MLKRVAFSLICIIFMAAFARGVTPVVIDDMENLNLWQAQNIYFSIGKDLLNKMEDRVRNGDVSAKEWVNSFQRLGHYLHVKI